MKRYVKKKRHRNDKIWFETRENRDNATRVVVFKPVIHGTCSLEISDFYQLLTIEYKMTEKNISDCNTIYYVGPTAVNEYYLIKWKKNPLWCYNSEKKFERKHLIIKQIDKKDLKKWLKPSWKSWGSTLAKLQSIGLCLKPHEISFAYVVP